MKAHIDTTHHIYYYPLDATRFIMAFLVIVIHTIKWNSLFITRILELAVPFFFLTSGFFLQRKSCSDTKQGKSEKQWLYRLLRLYFIWTMVYLPFSIYSCVHEGNTINNCVMGLLLGTGFYAWHLWYLVASIIGGGIICLCKKLKFNYLISFVLSLFSLVFISFFDRMFPNHYLIYAFERIITGWIFLIIGMGVWMLFKFMMEYKLISLSISILSLICYFLFGGLLIFLGITAFFILILLMCYYDSKQFNNFFNGRVLRKMSADIYFVHMVFVGILSLLIGIEDSFLKFVYVALLSIFFAYLRLIVNNFPMK